MRRKLHLILIPLIGCILSGVVIISQLSGQAIDAETGEPIAEVCIVGYNYNSRGIHSLAFGTMTGKDGRYKVQTGYPVKILYFKRGYETVLIKARHGENNKVFVGELRPSRIEEGRETGYIVGTAQAKAGNEIRPASEVKLALCEGGKSTEHIDITDSSGFFFIDNIPEGRYSLELSKKGYLTTRVDNVHVTADSVTFQKLDIQSSDEPVILCGQVRDFKKHKPLFKVKVELINEDGLVTSSDITDKNGFYFIHNVPRGNSVIRFSRKGYKVKNKSIQLLWVDDTLVNAELSAKPFWLFRLFSKKNTSVTGQVLDEESREPLGFTAVTIKKDGKTIIRTYTDCEGKFRILNIPPGEYKLLFSLLCFEPHKLSVKLEPGSENYFEVRLTMEKVIIVK